jgi:hypothetical protein
MTRRERDKSRGGTRFGREGDGETYCKRNVGHGKEGCKGVEELAEGCPFPLASEERDFGDKGVVWLWVVDGVGEGSGSGGSG